MSRELIERLRKRAKTLDELFRHIDADSFREAADALKGGVTDVLWQKIDRLLSDAYAAGMNGDDFDMLAARSALSTQRVEEGWRPVMQELVDAMRRYEVDVEADAPQKHRDMMDRADRLLAAFPASAPHEDEKWRSAFAAQSRKLQAVLHIPGVKEALADLDHTAPAPHAGVDAGPDWTKIYENVAHCPDRDSEMLTVTRETLRLAQAAIRQALDREIYHNYAAAFGEIRAALGDRT